VRDLDVQVAKTVGILRSPGSQGGQSRPRDSATTVHFDRALGDTTEESSSSATSPSRNSSTSAPPGSPIEPGPVIWHAPRSRAGSPAPPERPATPELPEPELMVEFAQSPLGRMLGGLL
jgi:hypothetical protein